MYKIHDLLKACILSGAVLLQTACHHDDDNRAPAAVINASQPSKALVTTYAFTTTGSSDSDGRIVSYQWDFGDGAASTETSPTHIFAGSGTYVVKLTLTDDDGAVTSVTQPVTITTPAVSVAVASAAVTVTLPQAAIAAIPEQAFPVATQVGVWRTADPATGEDFTVSAALFGTVLRATEEIRINTGKVKPNKALAVTASLPSELAARLQPNDEPKIFVQIYQDGGEEVLDNFELVPATYDPVAKTLRFDLDPDMLTDARTSDDTWEAVFLVGSTRTKPTAPTSLKPFLASVSPATPPELSRQWPAHALVGAPSAATPGALVLLADAAATTCEGGTLRAPLTDLTVTSGFNPPRHKGTDFRAANGTEVRAMADGKVTTVGFNERPLKKPDPRSGKLVKGWGNYIVVTHDDGSQSLYAHLQTGDIKVAVGDKVNADTLLALSDDSGGSQAPHLHVEYAPNGEIFKSGAKADPTACIGKNVAGNIEVADNGSAADDAFAVSINGKQVCATDIGQSNNCAIGALRTGTATLSITAIIAPDDVGTYGIALSGGLTFEDGTTSVTGSLAQGGSTNFLINIP